MDSNGNKETGTEAADSNPKVDAKELQHALNVLAKYGIIPDPKEILKKTGLGVNTRITARVKGEDGKIKKEYNYENGKLLEEK